MQIYSLHIQSFAVVCHVTCIDFINVHIHASSHGNMAFGQTAKCGAFFPVSRATQSGAPKHKLPCQDVSFERAIENFGGRRSLS